MITIERDTTAPNTAVQEHREEHTIQTIRVYGTTYHNPDTTLHTID